MPYKRNSSWNKFSRMLDAWLAHTHVRSVTMIISQIIRVFVWYESNQYSENLKITFLQYSVSAVRFLGKKKIYWDLGKCLLCALYATEQSFTLHIEIKSSTNKLYTMYQLTDISGRWSPVDGGYFLCTSP